MELGSFNYDHLVVPTLQLELSRISDQHEQEWLAEMHRETELQNLREKRDDYPTMYVKQAKKKRICQNMKGVLGGTNAFNFLSFVAGVITLVVNVNNNVNNNNNNLNGVNANANNQNNANANVNNNAANIIIAMPGRKKKRRKRTAQLFVDAALGSTKETKCLNMGLESELGNFPFAVLDLMKYYKMKVESNDRMCQEKFLCGSIDTLQDHFRDSDVDDNYGTERHIFTI